MPGAAPHDRLRDARDIAAVLRGRRQRAGRLLVVYMREVEPDAPARLAFVASRKVGPAVARNRAKRLMREAARHLPIRDGVELVLVARSTCASARMPQVLTELRELTEELDLVAPLADAS